MKSKVKQILVMKDLRVREKNKRKSRLFLQETFNGNVLMQRFALNKVNRQT